jgi:murein DD-endopeptidase MepM/ murein hydrolase activator NlpD
MRLDKISKNIYQLPFIGEIDIRPAPYHFEQVWQRNAVDFALDIGKPILAVEDGLVHKVIDGYGRGKLNEKFSNLCNLIMIEHHQGEYSGYAHLKKGILVNEGQQVKTGQIIGYSGLSGYTGYPHLHFQIMVRDSNGGWDGWMTIQTQFTVKGRVKILISPKK